jgi:3-hydroxy acid dehydrogenase/malonic semialdehyde reductase
MLFQTTTKLFTKIAGLHRPLALAALSRGVSSYGRQAQSRLAGKTVLLTGASAGIGAATALELVNAAAGDLRLILAARRTDRLNALADKITAEYPQAEVLTRALDVSDYKAVPKFVPALPAAWRDIDVLINNAGMVFGLERVGEIDAQDMEVMFHTNVLGLIQLTQSIVPGMRARGRGDILNIGSIAGLDPYAGGSVYCATKAAVNSFTHSLRKELIDTPIRVLEVQPGAVETEFSLVRFKGDKEKADKVYEGTNPLTAEDIAEVITFALTRRENTVVAQTLVFPSHQGSATSLHRKS